MAAVLAVLAVIGGGIAIFLLSQDDDSDTASQSSSTSTSEDPTSDTPTGASPATSATEPTAELPTAPSDLTFPTDLTDLSSLGVPTEGGPSEAQYFAVADKFLAAVQRGDCDAARAFITKELDATSDALLCGGVTGDAISNDVAAQHTLTVFGTYGAAVYYDHERTFISLVAVESNDPVIDTVIAY